MNREKLKRVAKFLVGGVLQIVVLVLLIVAGLIGYKLGTRHGDHGAATDATAASSAPDHDHSHATPPADEPLGYACAMNCLPPLEEPGPCPICGMEMQPVFEDPSDAATDADASPRRLTMAPEAVALLSVQTSLVERIIPTREVRLVGQLEVDPRRRAHISANVGGRIDDLRAEFEGMTVESGEDLAKLYSPELLAVQRELLQAVESAARVPGANADAMVEAARERLFLAGLNEDQIDELVESGHATEQVTLRAPFGGTVITRYVEVGDYVAREARIVTVANLDTLWAELEAFESDLHWLERGQRVVLRSNAHPGREFEGEVTWIEPISRAETRTTVVRVDVDNTAGLLRPEMFVSAIVESDPGESLVVPASAPLITGRRALVYTMREDADRPTFEGREVTLGPRVREGYIVLDGLNAGERVVTHGAFQIDSALQIRTRPSLMSPTGGGPAPGHAHHGPEDHSEHTGTESPSAMLDEISARLFDPDAPVAMRRGTFRRILPGYLELHEALAADDFDTAREAWSSALDQLDEELDAELHELMTIGHEEDTIGGLRVQFHSLSNHVIAALADYGNLLDTTLYRVHCPMAFDWDGADWIQTGDDVRNPYFGDEMYRCGTVEEEVAPQ